MGLTPTFDRDDLVAVAVHPGIGVGLAHRDQQWALATADPLATLAEIHAASSPRWVWWDRHTSSRIAETEIPIDRCWDVSVVHRLLFGGWKSPLSEVWAALHDLPLDTIPQMGQLDLLAMPDHDGDPDLPLQPDGHLRPEWIDARWRSSPQTLATWSSLALRAASLQDDLLGDLPDPQRARSTARSESAAELLCAEMARDGLPINTDEALRLIGRSAGVRPRSVSHEDTIRAERDGHVFDQLSPRRELNLRNPREVKAMLRSQGFDLPDTRRWRLEALRDGEPLIDALLTWRKAERIATTYGYGWLDENVSDGRLRGDWSSSDGAAGRMTASAGLHNLPAEMRTVVEAEPDHLFVRADLGQIEPRVLAAVSADRALVGAAEQPDLYLPVAKRLGVEREIAKVAVLGAMYGATTGESAHALAGLRKSYPTAMKMLEDAAEQGKLGHDVFTSGGRRVRMWTDPSVHGDLDRAISVAAARGRFARNALIQGAAAEFFKVWAITVRRHGRSLGARVVLCLHDELLVHCPARNAAAVADMVDRGVSEAAHYWSPTPSVKFVADVSIVQRWSEAK